LLWLIPSPFHVTGHVIDAPGAEPPPQMVDPNDDTIDVEQQTWIYNDDYVVASSPRLKSTVVPVIQHSWEAQGINMTVPVDAHLAARYEFGTNYMRPLLYRIQCEENLFVGRMSGTFYFTTITAAVIMIVVLVRNWHVLPSLLPPPPRLALP
jgi:hypothetical protein